MGMYGKTLSGGSLVFGVGCSPESRGASSGFLLLTVGIAFGRTI